MEYLEGHKPKSVVNNLPLGLILGIIIPLLTLIFINAEANKNLSIIEFLTKLRANSSLSALFSLCAIPNLALFFLFIWKNNYLTVKGVMMATIFMVILVYALKFYY